MGIPKFRTINTITFAAVIAVLALWVNRYLIVVPTLETPYMPIQDTRPEWLFYSATWVEWVLTFGGIAMFCFLFTLAAKIVPIIPVSEVADAELEMSETIAKGQDSHAATVTVSPKKHVVLKKEDHEQ